MKFDFIIGNPPFNRETENTSDSPLYNRFMDEAYRVREKVCLITPARFLFNAGKTPKAWNRKMLSDPHLKVLMYEPDVKNVFPDLGFKGGVTVTYRDASRNYGAIEAFYRFPELNSIVRKVKALPGFSTLSNIITPTSAYRFTPELHKDFPNAVSILSKGHENDVVSNVFDTLGDMVFFTTPPELTGGGGTLNYLAY